MYTDTRMLWMWRCNSASSLSASHGKLFVYNLYRSKTVETLDKMNRVPFHKDS